MRPDLAVRIAPILATICIATGVLTAGGHESLSPAVAQADGARFARLELGTAVGDDPVARAVAVDGDQLLAGFGDRLVVADARGDGPEQALGSVEVSGDILALAAERGTVFVLTTVALCVVDTREPTRPALLSTTGRGVVDAGFGDLALARGHVLVGDARGVHVFEVVQAAAPRLVAELSFGGAVGGLDVAGDLAVVAVVTAPPQINIIDVADPARAAKLDFARLPAGLGGLPTFTSMDVALAGHRAVVSLRSATQSWLLTADVSDEGSLTWLGRQPSPATMGWPRITVAGSRAYVAGGGLARFDLDTSGSPAAPAWFMDTDNEVNALAVSGDTLFVAGSRGVDTIAVEDPDGAGTRVVGDVPGPIGIDGRMATAGSRAYIVTGPDERLDVVDLSEPSDPRLAGSYTFGDQYAVRAIAAAGTRAYVSFFGDTLAVIEAADPDRPHIVAYVHDLPLNDLSWSEGYLYGASAQDGLVVVDVADPMAPRRLSGTALAPPEAKGAHLVATSPQRAVLVGQGGTLAIFDTTDPAAPRRLGSLTGLAGEALDLALVHDTALVLYTDGVLAVDLADPTAPVIRSQLNLGPWLEQPQSIAAVGELAVVTGSGVTRCGLVVLDASDPGQLRALSGRHGHSHRMVASPDLGVALMMVSERPTGSQFLNVVAVDRPHDFQVRARLALPGGGLGLALGPDLAYVAAGRQGLHVMDLADPSEPRRAATLELDASVDRVVTDGDRAYLALSDAFSVGTLWQQSALGVVDLSAPTRPRLAAMVPLDGLPIADLAVYRGSAVLLLNQLNHLPVQIRIVDAGSGNAPPVIGALDLSPSRTLAALAVAGDHAFVLDTEGTLLVVDLITPARPVLVARMKVSDRGEDLDVADGLAYVLSSREQTGAGILNVVDVGDPARPRRRGAVLLDSLQKLAHVRASGQWAWLTAPDFGLRLVDVADADNPRLVAEYRAPGAAWRVASPLVTGLAAAGDRAYVTSADALLWTIEARAGACAGCDVFLPSVSRP